MFFAQTTGRGTGGGPALTHVAHQMSAAWATSQANSEPGSSSFLAKMNIWEWKYKLKIFPENMATPFLGNN